MVYWNDCKYIFDPLTYYYSINLAKHNSLQESSHDVIIQAVDDDPILSITTFEELKV